MSKKKCIDDNCIPTPSSCVEWNGGELPYLGICNGDSLNNIVIEIISKLKEVTGEDLSEFDIDALLDICSQKAPSEITILSILNVLKNNQICLKDFIDTLKEGLDALFQNTGVTVDLKCYAQFDNLGNPLSINREQFDQLLIDTLCNHEGRLTVIEGILVLLQAQIDALNVVSTVDELSIATCINGAILPTSTQLQNTSTELCDLETAAGLPADISTALANTPGDLNAEFGLISGWTLVPANWAENYGNLLLQLENMRQRIITIENTCCSSDCDDVKLGFSASYNGTNTEIDVKFTSSAGTNIPAGFVDSGSTITITDIDDNEEVYITVNPNLIANNATISIPIPSLNITQDLKINVEANFTSGGLTCNKCLAKIIQTPTELGCTTCKLCATGDAGTSVLIVYESAPADGTNIKTVVLIPGECVIFPDTITINSIIPTGAITVDSTCPEILVTPSGYKCWQFKWEYDGESNFSDAYMVAIKVGGIEYPLLDSGTTNTWDNGGDFLASSIPISVPVGMVDVMCNAGGVAVNPKIVAVQIPADLEMPLIRYLNPGFDMGYLIPYEDECGC